MQEGLYLTCKLWHGDTIHGKHLRTGNYLQLRTLHLLLDVEVGNAFHVFYRFTYLIAKGIHAVEVGAEELDGYSGAGA